MEALVACVWFLHEVAVSLLVVFDEGSEAFLRLGLLNSIFCTSSVRLSAQIVSG